MRTSITGLTALALSMLASPAFAQDEAEDTSSVTISGSASVVTDYRFRGISQTDKDFAVQAGFTVAHDSGFYVSVWGSSVDEYVAAGSDQEIDLIGGFKKTFGGTTFDVGVLYYYYPGAEKFIPGYDSDFIEPYVSVSHTFGPVSAKLTANYAPKQSAIGLAFDDGEEGTVFKKEDNLYIAGDFGVGIPNTPVSVSAHLGHSFGPSFLTIGKEYTDWSVGATYAFKNLSFGVAYVDTNKSSFSYDGKNIAKAGVVGTIGVSF